MLYPHIIEEVCEYISQNNLCIVISYIKGIDKYIDEFKYNRFNDNVINYDHIISYTNNGSKWEIYDIYYPKISNIRLFERIIESFDIDKIYNIRYTHIGPTNLINNMMKYHYLNGDKCILKIMIKMMIIEYQYTRCCKNICNLNSQCNLLNFLLDIAANNPNKGLYNYIIKKHQIEYRRTIDKYLKK